jgi:hypothetical protein
MFRVRIGDAPGTPIRKQVVTSNSMLIVAGCYPCAKCANRSSNKARPYGRIAQNLKGTPFGRMSKTNPRAPGGAKERRISTTVPNSEALAGSGGADRLCLDLGYPQTRCRSNSGQSEAVPFPFISSWPCGDLTAWPLPERA